MRYLKQSTSVDVGIGPFLDETDGKTAETALTITQPDIRLKKNGGAWAQKAAAQTLSHEENGWYELTLDTTDTDTCGILLVAVHESGALPVWCEFHVLEEAIYDALFAASANAFSGAAGSTTLTALASGSITAAVVATGAIDADAIAADAVTEIQSGLATAAALSTVAGYLDTEIAAILADTNELQVDWTDGGRLDLLIDAIKAKTDNLPSDPADASVIAGRFDTLDTSIADLPTVAEFEARTIVAANYATAAALDTVDNFLDTEIAAIKAKTDSLTFTVAGKIDSNVLYVNGTQIDGAGTAGDPWGPV